MKITAEITQDQLKALAARQLKIEPADLTLAVDEQGQVTGHVATDDDGYRRIRSALKRAAAGTEAVEA